jgi:D-glycero-D-manno-heptose 1,7-bisphosphate phosphatase
MNMSLIKQKILFLDRDGTICYDDGAFGSEKLSYKEVIEKTRPLEGVKESLKVAKDKGYLLVVISNQAGIAKGRFDECDTHYSNKLLQEKLGGLIDGFYYCPHHTSGKNNKGIIADNAKRDLIFHCDCRKPEIGMFLQCENDLKNGKIQYIDEKMIANKVSYEYERNKIFKRDITASLVDKENSYMIGDKWLDVLAGERYGVNPIFVMSGEGYVEYHHKKDDQKELPKKYEIFNDINDFIKERL